VQAVCHSSVTGYSTHKEKEEKNNTENTSFREFTCATLIMAPTVTHDLEIAGKRTLSDEEWLQVQHTFYDGFAIVGGVGEMLSLNSTGALAYLLRKQ
jgi:hypothetical protein